MTDAGARYELDLGSNSCRLRIDGAKPGRPLKVLVRDKAPGAAAALHGTGVLDADASVFTATFPSSDGEQTLALDWQALKAALAKYPRYD